MKWKILLTWLLAGLSILGCKQAPLLPVRSIASKLIQERIIENGNMPGGNMIEIHRFDIQTIEPGNTPNTARVSFEIDFTRYPTSGLAPEYQTEQPMRQTEKHLGTLSLDKEQWTVTDLSLR